MSRNGYLFLVATLLVARGQALVSAERPGVDASYSVEREAREGTLLKLDWHGDGRELMSRQVIEVLPAAARRMTFVSINFKSHALPWRSTLDRKLRSGEISPRAIRTEPIQGGKLVRAYIPNDEDAGDFFFKEGVGPELNGNMYVAQCSSPFPWEKGAVHCSTQIEVDAFAVEIRFDKAFLWDFDSLQATAVAATKDYLARPSTQRLIEGIPKLNLR